MYDIELTQQTEDLSALLAEIAACQHCAADLPLGPRPVVRASAPARLMIIGQAPGTKVHASGVPWDDASGDRLRRWLGLDRAAFYDTARMHFNKAVTQIRELTNTVADCKDPGPAADWAHRFGTETIAQLIGPMMPHLAEEMSTLPAKDLPQAEGGAAALADDTVQRAIGTATVRKVIVVPNKSSTSLRSKAVRIGGGSIWVVGLIFSEIPLK